MSERRPQEPHGTPARTTVFISGTSTDLKSFRRTVVDALLLIGIHPVAQDHFTPDHRTVEEMLREKIRDCDAVICLVGFVYGAERQHRPAGQPRRSYTQLEFDIAGELGKAVYRFLAEEHCDFDAMPEEPEELRLLQRDHRAALSGGNQLFRTFASKDALEKQILVIPFPHRVRPAPAGQPPRFLVPMTLPTTPNFIGRQDDLRQLDRAWDDPKTNVFTVHAWGGVGKTALVGHWLGLLARDGYRGMEVFYQYSFEGAAGDAFIERALRLFGDGEPAAGGTPEEKGARLADLVRQKRALLWLDGFEAVQEQDGAAGQIKSPALRALVCALAAYNPGLCVIGTRLPVSDLNEWAPTAPALELQHLPPAAGADLLQALEVVGPRAELEQAAREVHGHALSLNLLGSYLAESWFGDVRMRAEFQFLAEGSDSHKQARRIMESYEQHLAAKNRQALAALRLVSLFIRDARPESVKALLAAPAIPGLTDELAGLRPPQWNALVALLRKRKLLSEPPEGADLHGRATLTTHPLVREYFAEGLRRQHPAAFREGHHRLARHFADSVPQHEPDTTVQMGPLYLAIGHGCQAGLFDEMLDKIYWPRIKRGERHFNTKTLGAFNVDLAVLGRFFDEPWRRFHEPVRAAARRRLLYEVGFDLRALGRLDEAEEPLAEYLALCIQQEEWIDGAKVAGDLSLLYITLGRLGSALEPARTAVELADRSGCPFERVRARSNWVNALLQRDELATAEQAFHEAEQIVHEAEAAAAAAKGRGRRPTLQSYWFYELHLERRDYARVEELASQKPPELSSTGTPLLDLALANVALARARMGRAGQAADGGALLLDAASKLDSAHFAITQAGTKHHLPRVLLARATLHRTRREWDQAELQLQEARAVAAHGGMKIHLADVLLESTRLHLGRGDRPRAAVELERAADLVEELGYRRREADVDELKRALLAGAALSPAGTPGRPT
jgi:hypothetical protein